MGVSVRHYKINKILIFVLNFDLLSGHDSTEQAVVVNIGLAWSLSLTRLAGLVVALAAAR